MHNFLIHIREKKNILTRDWQNGRADYYVIRIFDMLESEAFNLLEMEKQQIIDACHHGVDYEKSPYKNAEEYYDETYGETH